MPKILDAKCCTQTSPKERRSVLSTEKTNKALPIMAEADIAIARIAPETSFKNKAYEALKEAILKMDIYA